ncbi:hypothetical protein [Chryseolinea lacunae]|nr:hypothetical protein [Chryseolinea lacunae]
MEDNYVKHRFGPLDAKGWKFAIDSVMRYDRSVVFKISGRKSASETAVLHIDTETFAILRIELRERMVNGEFYRRYLNLPDPYGQQETSFTMLFEFREFEGKMYLKYQREEDTYNLFNKTTNAIILKQSFMKELFVNNVLPHQTHAPDATMNMNRSVEGQAKPYNEAFWKYYNAPVETARDSQILKALSEMESKP